MMAGSMNVHAQKARNRRMGIKTDSIIQVKDSLVIDSLKLLEERQKIENMEAPVDTAALVRKNDSIQKGDTVNYDLDMDKISDLIDSLCDMSKIVNGTSNTAR